nr:PREDICTED: protein FAR1-RELATED SEQUENCE 5-like [Daucus carota subsp. sativus]
MASYIFQKLTSPSKPITPNKPRIEIVEEVVDNDVEEVGDDDVEEGGRLVLKSLDEGTDVHKRRRNWDSICRTHFLAGKYVVHREKLKKWEVTLVNLKHNPTMISKDEVLFMQRPRNIIPVIRQLNITLIKSGIGPSNTLNMLGELPGAWENIGFSNEDVRNVLRDIRHYVFDSSNALEGLALLGELKRNSQGEFFYKLDVDEENRVLNAFVPFTGVNHHYQSILFGFALIRDETEESYLWVFKSWLEAMGNVAPQTIITDQDIAIGNTIAEVLPNTIHLYCTWHIRTKFGEILSHLYANHDHFKEDFNSCIYKSLMGAQFEDRWEALGLKYDLMNHSWLQDMYSVRHKWVRVYTKLHFTTGMTTTSRSESMNSFFDEFVNASTGLKEFIENSRKTLEKQKFT